MNRLQTLLVAAVVGTMTLGSTAASAQAWGHEASMADETYWSTHRLADLARHDEHEADAAACRGDSGAAAHYAEAADRDRWQAARDADYARHKDRVAR